MEFPLKSFFFIFLLSAATGQFQTKSAEIHEEEKSRKFHIDEHKVTRQFPKAEMDGNFSDQWEKMTRSHSEIISKLESLNSKLEILTEKTLKIQGNQEELSTKFFRTLHENMEMKLSDSFNKRQTSSDLKMEMSLRNLSATLTQKLSTTESKLEKLLWNLSALFAEELERNELKEEASLQNVSESFDEQLTKAPESLSDPLQRNSKQPSGLLANSTHFLNPIPKTSGLTTPSTVESQTEIQTSAPTPTQTEVEKVKGKSGIIEFTGGANSHLRRKIWIFRSESGNSFLDMNFELEENGLGENARLSIWDSFRRNGGQHVWTGSQSDWMTEQSCGGHVIVLTLSIFPSPVKKPSFKLKFNTIAEYSDDGVYLSELLLGEGRQVASFASNNTRTRDSHFVALIAPPHGRPMELTLKYLDLPGTLDYSCNYNHFIVYFLVESSIGKPYNYLPSSAYKQCGKFGHISETLGNSTVAILHLFTDSGSSGKGFRVEANPI